MNILDIILLLCLLLTALLGLKKGFIAQVVAIISIVAGGWLAYKFSIALSVWLKNWIDASGQALEIISFIVIFILVVFGLFLLGRLLEATIKIIMLGWLNRLLGFIFAALKFVLIAGLLIMVLDSMNDVFHFISEDYLDNSFMYSGIRKVADAFFPYLQQLI